MDPGFETSTSACSCAAWYVRVPILLALHCKGLRTWLGSSAQQTVDSNTSVRNKAFSKVGANRRIQAVVLR